MAFKSINFKSQHLNITCAHQQNCNQLHHWKRQIDNKYVLKKFENMYLTRDPQKISIKTFLHQFLNKPNN